LTAVGALLDLCQYPLVDFKFTEEFG